MTPAILAVFALGVGVVIAVAAFVAAPLWAAQWRSKIAPGPMAPPEGTAEATPGNVTSKRRPRSARWLHTASESSRRTAR